MKYVIMLFMAIGVYSAASAQYERDEAWRVNGWHDRDGRDYQYNNRYNNAYRFDQINREFDQRVWQVQNDWTLTRREKRRIIHEINEQREERIKAARRFARRGDWDND